LVQRKPYPLHLQYPVGRWPRRPEITPRPDARAH